MSTTKLTECTFRVISISEIEANIDDILFNLDFDTILKVANLVGFGGINADTYASDLKYNVKNALIGCYLSLDSKAYRASKQLDNDEEFYECEMSTGGFHYLTQYYPESEKKLYTSVKFVITDWNNYD
jgi:hypothetical protein